MSNLDALYNTLREMHDNDVYNSDSLKETCLISIATSLAVIADKLTESEVKDG